MQCVYSSELLGKAKAILPKWSRKTEISEWMIYAEIKAYYIGAKDQ